MYIQKNYSGQNISPRVIGGVDTPWSASATELTAIRVSDSGSLYTTSSMAGANYSGSDLLITDEESKGLFGFDVLTATEAEAGSWFAIRAIDAAAAVEASASLGDPISCSLQQDTYLYGPFTEVTCSSGDIICHRRGG